MSRILIADDQTDVLEALRILLVIRDQDPAHRLSLNCVSATVSITPRMQQARRRELFARAET